MSSAAVPAKALVRLACAARTAAAKEEFCSCAKAWPALTWSPTLTLIFTIVSGILAIMFACSSPSNEPEKVFDNDFDSLFFRVSLDVAQ